MVTDPKRQVEHFDYWVRPNGRVDVIDRSTNEAFSVPEQEAVELIQSGNYDPITPGQSFEERMKQNKQQLEALSDSPAAAFTHGVLSAATGGLFDLYTHYSPLEKYAARKRAESDIDEANKTYAEAIASGNKLNIKEAESRLHLAKIQAKGVVKQIESRDKAIREHTKEVISKSPVSNVAGEIFGTLIPTGAVGLAGRGAVKLGTSQLQKQTARLIAEGAAIGAQQSIARTSREGEGVSVSDIVKSATLGAGFSLGAGALGYGLQKVAKYPLKRGADYMLKKAGQKVEGGIESDDALAFMMGKRAADRAVRDIDDLVAKTNDPALSANWAALKRADDEILEGILDKSESIQAVAGMDATARLSVGKQLSRVLTPDELATYSTGEAVDGALRKITSGYPHEPMVSINLVNVKREAKRTLQEFHKAMKESLPIIGEGALLRSLNIPRWLVFGGAGYAATQDPYLSLLSAAAPWALSKAVLYGPHMAQLYPKTEKVLRRVFDVSTSTAPTIGAIKYLSNEQYIKSMDIIDTFSDDIIFKVAYDSAINVGYPEQVAVDIADRQTRAFNYLKKNSRSKGDLSKAIHTYLNPKAIVRDIYNKNLTTSQQDYLKVVYPEVLEQLKREAKRILDLDRRGDVKISYKSKAFLNKIVKTDNKTLLYQQIAHGKQGPEGPKSNRKMRGAEIATTPLQSARKNLGGI